MQHRHYYACLGLSRHPDFFLRSDAIRRFERRLRLLDRHDADLYEVSFHAIFFPIVEHALTEPSQIFTLEIDGRPTLVFEATEFAEARQICLDADLRSDLRALTSDGIPICTETATLNARPAVEEEVVAFERALKLGPASDEPTMAFLVKIDGVIVIAVDPP